MTIKQLKEILEMFDDDLNVNMEVFDIDKDAYFVTPIGFVSICVVESGEKTVLISERGAGE